MEKTRTEEQRRTAPEPTARERFEQRQREKNMPPMSTDAGSFKPAPQAPEGAFDEKPVFQEAPAISRTHTVQESVVGELPEETPQAFVDIRQPSELDAAPVQQAPGVALEAEQPSFDDYTKWLAEQKKEAGEIEESMARPPHESGPGSTL